MDPDLINYPLRGSDVDGALPSRSGLHPAVWLAPVGVGAVALLALGQVASAIWLLGCAALLIVVGGCVVAAHAPRPAAPASVLGARVELAGRWFLGCLALAAAVLAVFVTQYVFVMAASTGGRNSAFVTLLGAGAVSAAMAAVIGGGAFLMTVSWDLGRMGRSTRADASQRAARRIGRPAGSRLTQAALVCAHPASVVGSTLVLLLSLATLAQSLLARVG